MTRSVVFKTPGKLDLRSVMTFGLNAKPATGHPIGFFGTGLKYAIAVLARENIPVTFYIDGKRWGILKTKANFRGKDFYELSIVHERSLLHNRVFKLPFTTELGKTWKLWQAFRELESNTRDEKGETRVEETNTSRDMRDCTIIEVESEEFVQEYFDRDKTFLTDGLTMQSSTEDVQVFDRPADAIYYRGIRVLDLKEEERSNLTYNILRQMELTEDRTLKSRWDADYYISQAIVKKQDPDIIEKVVTAHPSSFEGKLNYTYGSPSKEFLDVADKIDGDRRNYAATAMVKHYRPPPVKASTSEDWFQPIIDGVRDQEYDKALDMIRSHRETVIQIFTRAQAEWNKERINNGLYRDVASVREDDDGGTLDDGGPYNEPPSTGDEDARTKTDDIPF